MHRRLAFRREPGVGVDDLIAGRLVAPLRSASAVKLDFAYRILSGDDSDERACQAIPDSACTAPERAATRP